MLYKLEYYEFELCSQLLFYDEAGIDLSLVLIFKQKQDSCSYKNVLVK